MFHRFSIHFHQHDHLHHCQQRHHWILGIHNHPKLCLPKLQGLVEIQFQNFHVPLLLVFSRFAPKSFLSSCILQHQQQDLVHLLFHHHHHQLHHSKLCLPKLQGLVEIQFQNFLVPLLLVFSCFDHPKLCLPKLQFQNSPVPLLLVFFCFVPTSFLSSWIFQHQQQDLVRRLFQKEGFDFVQSRCDFCVLGHFCHFQCFLFLLLKQTSFVLCCSLPSGSNYPILHNV